MEHITTTTSNNQSSNKDIIWIVTSVLSFSAFVAVAAGTIYLWKRNRDNQLRLKLWRMWGHAADNLHRPIPPTSFPPLAGSRSNSASTTSCGSPSFSTQSPEYVTLFSSPFATVPASQRGSLAVNFVERQQ